MTVKRDGVGIVWFRRDLRLDDNPAWATATSRHDEVVALFVLEPRLLQAASAHRRDQLLAHLAALDESLRRRGGCLTVRTGPASDAVPAVVGEVAAGAVHVNDDVTAFGRQRDADVERSIDAVLERHHGAWVHPPGSVLTTKGTLSQVFTPFFRKWSATALRPWPRSGGASVLALRADPLPAPASSPRHAPGATAAWARLERWIERVDDYAETRDVPSVDGTSDLSTDLKFGTLSPRAVFDEVGVETEGRAAFVRQLAWRDWWAHTLAVRPDLVDTAMKPRYDEIRWRDDPDGFEAWATGRTGFPLVDAGMRQLVETGWMHNRLRMICASFLVKDLLIDWRRGERLFRHHLVDADTPQNVGNWQWVAGTGPDAAPYFRVFNPTAQSRRFDPRGRYIRRWVPELAALDDDDVHEPAAAGPLAAQASGIELGVDYPFPIVDHAEARRRALSEYSERAR